MSIKEIIENTKSVAVIGLSSDTYRTSHRVTQYLMDHGYEIIPVNPNETAVFGKTSYPSILDLPEDWTIDLVVIFRNHQYTASMVREIVEWSEKTGQKAVIWTQIGVSSPHAKELAEKHSLTYVRNKCIMVEHSQL